MFCRICLVFVLLFFFHRYSYAGDYTDSLETKLILVDNPTKLLILDELIPYYFRNEPSEAQKKAIKMLGIASQENNEKYKIRAQRYIGLSNSHLISDHELALEECRKAESNAKVNGFTAELVLTRLALADIYSQIGEIPKALEYQIMAHHIADSAGLMDLKSITLNNQARSCIELEDYDKAEQCLRQSLKHAKVYEQEEMIAESNMIFGDLFGMRFNHELALIHYREAYDIYLKKRKDIQLAIALFKIGDSFFSLDQLDTAFHYHLNALTIRNRIKDRRGLAESYNQIGLICTENGEYQRAINNLRLGLNNAEMINSNTLMKQSFDYLYQAYHALGDYENALRFHDKYMGISELLYAEASERRIKEIENQQEIDERDRQIRNLKEQERLIGEKLATQKRFTVTLILLLLVIVISVVFFIRSYREKRRINKELKRINNQVTEQNQQLIEVNNMKDKFFSIIGHDLKGPLNSLTSFSQLLINHSARLTEQEIRTIASDLDMSLKNLYELLENLLGWARSQTNKIEFSPELFKIADVVRENIQLLSKAALNKNISIEMRVDEAMDVYADINSIRTIIRNLLSNAIKFTFPGGVITIFVEEWKDYIEVGIRDTGVGINKDDLNKIFDISAKHSTRGTNKEKGTGLGLILCKEFVERNKGKIMVDSKVDQGTTFRFTIPKYEIPEGKKMEEIRT